MNKNFHYHAIKTIARETGFCEDDAELIACCSQLVDDFTDFKPFFAKNVPDYAKHLTIPVTFGSYVVDLFIPVSTGFSLLTAPSEKVQKLSIIPFHFIPEKHKLNEHVDSRAEWRTVPARMDRQSLIQTKMLEILSNSNMKYQDKLVSLGLLLHTFADTYAHQMFSGYHGWENYCQLSGVYNVLDSNSNHDLSNSVINYIGQRLLAVGHANVAHVPDDTEQRFTFRLKTSENSDYDIFYGRSNPIEFTKCAREINGIMEKFLLINGRKDDIKYFTKSRWESFTVNLCRAMLQQSEDLLNQHWHSIFGYDYHYSRDNVFGVSQQHDDLTENPDFSCKYAKLKELIPNTPLAIGYKMNNNYYRFNVQAYDLRSFVNGGNVVDEEREKMVEIINNIQKI